jgi:hypothetical protein
MNASLGLSGRVRFALLGCVLGLAFAWRDELKAVPVPCPSSSVEKKPEVQVHALDYWVAEEIFPVLIHFDKEVHYNEFMSKEQSGYLRSAYLCYTPEGGASNVVWELLEPRWPLPREQSAILRLKAHKARDGRGIGTGIVIVTDDRGGKDGKTKVDKYRAGNDLVKLRQIP